MLKEHYRDRKLLRFLIEKKVLKTLQIPFFDSLSENPMDHQNVTIFSLNFMFLEEKPVILDQLADGFFIVLELLGWLGFFNFFD